MTDFYWVAGGAGAASAFARWSTSSGGSALSSWPGSSPTTTDNFILNSKSAHDCTWDIAAVQSIQMSIADPYLGNLKFAANVALEGFICNGNVFTSSSTQTLTFSGAGLTALQDSAGRKRFVLNGKLANPDTSNTNLQYIFSPSNAQVYFDNGPYNVVTIQNNYMRLGYNVPTVTEHTYADDGFIHIKNNFTAAATGGFGKGGVVPNAAADSAVKIKFDTTSFTYAGINLDPMLATCYFRGITIPTTGDTVNYGSDTFTTKYHGVVIFASAAGDKCSIPANQILDCYSLEIEGGARLVSTAAGNQATIRCQTLPTIKGGWSFKSLSPHEFVSPRNNNAVAQVARGGTGISAVPVGCILFGQGEQQPMTPLAVGTNGHVLTLSSGLPTWAASGGGGGGMTSFTLAGSSGANQTITDGNTLTLAQGTGITTVGSATDTVTITNTGVTSNVAGSGIGVSGATGAVTITNSGVTSAVAGTAIGVSGATGAVTFTNTGVTSAVAGDGIGVSGATGAVTIASTNTAAASAPAPAFSAVPDENNPAPLIPHSWIQITIAGQVYHVPAWIQA
jgi:hypothetical protein